MEDNDFTKLLTTYVDNRWNWFEVSRNPNITWEFINNHIEYRWSWEGISENPNITWEIILENPKLPWVWYFVSRNPNITLEIVSNNLNLQQTFGPKAVWDKNLITTLNGLPDVFGKSLNQLETMTFKTLLEILSNPEIVHHKSFEAYIHDIKSLDVNYMYYLSSNKGLTWEIIKNYPTEKWDWKSLSKHPNITWDIIFSSTHLPWDWRQILQNPNITWEMIQNNKHLFRNLKSFRSGMQLNHFSHNPNLTYDIIQSNKYISWNWYTISSNNFKKDPAIDSKRRELFTKILSTIFNNY